MELAAKIKDIAGDRFEFDHLNQFCLKYQELSAGVTPIDWLINLSIDQGNELEISFFTNNHIFDITLSKGVIYSYKYETGEIKSIVLTESEDKWTLNILGKKRFDYNVVKPGSPAELIRYQKALEGALKNRWF